MKAFQDYYGDGFNRCYGCGTKNPEGYHLKSYWDANGEDTIARFTPEAKYSGGTDDVVYGGMIASLLDCHGTGSAAAYLYRDQGRNMGDNAPPLRCVTASLTINFHKPTPMGTELQILGKLRQVDGRKVWLDLILNAHGETCVSGEMLAIAIKTQ